MKKKLFGVFTAILLFVACIGLYACKGKYDDLQFRIFYAYTENAENWIDGTGGIDCFYGDEDGQLPIKDGSSKIYIKVVVENVKAKHVGDIFVSCRTESTGTSFNGAIVKQDEVFSVEMSGKASIVLNVREANSQKNTDVQINASYPLERMEANYDVMPALYADETLDLNQVKEQIINFYPLGQTNQLDVSFAVNSVGFFDAQNEYQRSSKTSLLLSSNAVSITNSVLRLSNYSIDLINVDNYVLEIIAKSSAVADPVTLYVYVLPSADRSVAPQVEYKNDLENAAINGPIVLYSQSGEAENNYSSATLQANANVQSPFVKGVRTKNGLVNYNIALYVDDERVDFSSSSQKVDDENGLIFENPNKEENIFTINSTSNGSIGNLLIDFRLEVNEFLFSNEHRPAKSEFFVQKGQLASGIIVGNRDLGNSRPYTNGGVYTDSIYATQGETKPIFLNLDINSPQSSSQNITAYSIDSSLRILNQNLEVVAGGSIENRSQISVNFANQTATNGSMILRVRNNPETFQGVVCEASYIDVTITITKVVAPDAFVVYRDRDFTQTINSTNRERWLYLGVGEENSFFVRAYYTGTAFDQTCVQITSSNFAFADGTTSAQLGGYLKGGVELDGDFAGKPYYDYEIKFAQINALGVSSINIVAGVNIGVEYVFTAESKMISSGEFTINELAESLDVTKVNEFVTNGNKYFNYALVLDKSANFEVLGKGKDANQGFLASYVSGIHVSAVDVDLVSEHISLDAVAVDDRVLSQYNNLFKATGVASERTTMIKIAVDYYVFDGYCKLMSGENAAEIYVQFAVYTPIERFDNLNATSSLLTYVDENAFLDENLASSTVSFVAKTILGRSPSSSVWFYNPTSENLEEVKNATSVKLYTSQKTIDSTVELTYNHERIDTGAILSNDASITVRLTGGKTMDSIRIWFTALRFGQESNKSSRDVIINFRDSAKADRVEIYNGDDGDIVVEGDGINNVYVSYIDVEDDETLVNKKFYATAQYPNSNNNDYKSYRLGYRIYAVTIDGETVNEELVDTISGVEINIQDSEVSISAYKPASTGGGRYKVYIYALDNPDASNSVNLIISDGSRNNPYILSSPEDFRKIQKNLNAHYVLGADISQDNLTITGEFNGTLSGLMQQLDKNNQTYFLTHSITTRLTQSSDNDNRYLSIFQRLGEDAEISDLIVNVGIDSITNNSQANLYAGALAGINNGRIINVEVGINEIAEVQLDIGIGSIYFGGIVGQNNGEINMGNSSVNIYSLKLDLKASSGNRILVGALSGENVGEIIGNYQGKSSLDDIIYTVVANLTVKASGVELNVGGVAGSNNRNIRNMIVGGKIQVNASNSYLGGIAGEGQPASTISTSAVLALDLENTLGAAAGIVGKTNQAVINDVRVLLADANFFEVGVKSQGRIFGKTQSAGIVAQSTGSTITFASVEDFIGNENGEDFFAIQGEDTVAGLVHGSNTEIKSSFVNANLGAATSVCLTSNALNESGTYFIGKVQNFTFANQSNLTLNANTTYAILYTDENLYYKAYNSTNLVEKTMSLTSGMDIVQTSSDEAHKKYEIYGAEFRPEEGGTYELKYDLAQVYRLEGDRYVPLKETDIIHSSDQFVVLTDWETFVKDTLLASAGSWEGNTLVLSGGTTFKLDSEINSIAFKGLSLFFPFVCSVDGDKVEPFMVISPQSIQTNFNEGYVLFIKSNLLEGEIDIGSLIDAGEIKISEILLVNYFEFSNGASSSAYNTHYLINKTRMVNGSEQTLGLLDRTIEPESAQGGVKFEIVYGTNFASLSADGEQITFNGVSGTSPILLRCYSIFNPSKQSFVIFFTQSGISNLKVNSTSVEILEDTGNDPEEDVDYQFTTHSSVGRINLTLEAENLFEGQR